MSYEIITNTGDKPSYVRVHARRQLLRRNAYYVGGVGFDISDDEPGIMSVKESVETGEVTIEMTVDTAIRFGIMPYPKKRKDDAFYVSLRSEVSVVPFDGGENVQQCALCIASQLDVQPESVEFCLGDKGGRYALATDQIIKAVYSKTLGRWSLYLHLSVAETLGFVSRSYKGESTVAPSYAYVGKNTDLYFYGGDTPETLTTQQAGSDPGTKFDGGKPTFTLLPWDALAEVQKVLDFGAKKYAARNWEKGISNLRLANATIRHITDWMDGKDIDDETSLSVVAHAACEVLFLLAHIARDMKAFDDRPGVSGRFDIGDV